MTPIAVNRNPLPRWQRLMDRLLPQPCRFCGGPGAPGEACCEACRRDLPWAGPGCRCCALPLPAEAGEHCGRCLSNPPPFTATLVAFTYQWPADKLIKALKFQGRLADGALLGALLSRRLEAAGAVRPERLVPVPLHPGRLRRRGFNQAHEIAASLGRQLGIPVEPGLLERSRATDPQTGLSAAARRRNLQGAFRCPRNPGLRHVALVDDVVTTGTTIRAAAACLARHGVDRVDVWAVARAR